MKALVDYFARRSLLVNMITIAVVIAGSVAATMIPRALLPPVKSNHVYVSAVLPGATATEMESSVTYRIEEALDGLSNVEKMTSETYAGRCEVMLQLKGGTTPDEITPRVEEAVRSVQRFLPKDLDEIRVSPSGENGMNDVSPVGFYILGFDESKVEHRNAVLLLADSLRRVSGVLSVEDSLRYQELFIELKPEKVRRFGINARSVRQQLLARLSPHPVGGLRVRDEFWAVELLEPTMSLESIRSIPVQSNRGGLGITLGEIAAVDFQYPKETTRRLYQGKPTTNVVAMIDGVEDVVGISKNVVDAAMKQGENFPEGLSLEQYINISEVIEHELDTLVGGGLLGIVLVFIILTLFLGARVAMMTAFGLPFCYGGLVLVCAWFDISFNIFSLVPMLLVLGILVDDAIIVAEEYAQLRQRGYEPYAAASLAVRRMAKPVLGMMATTTIVFAPLLILKGPESALIKPFPIIVMAALFLSLVESFFLLPNHLAHFAPNVRVRAGGRVMASLQRGYEKALNPILRGRYGVLIVFLALLIVAVTLIQNETVKFRGDLNLSNNVTLYVELEEAASSLDALQRFVEPIEAIVKEAPVPLYGRHETYLGSATVNGNALSGWKYAHLDLKPSGTFVEQEQRRFALGDWIDENFREAKLPPGIRRVWVSGKSKGETRDVVKIYVSGADRVGFSELQSAVRTTVKEIEGATGVFWDESRFQRGFGFNIDDSALARYAISKPELQAQLRPHFDQEPLARLRFEGRDLSVYTKYQGGLNKLVDLQKITITSARGLSVPLSFLGEWVERETLRRIDHEDLLRAFTLDVMFNADETDAEKVAEGLEEKLKPLRDRYVGYHISVKPTEFEQKAKSHMQKLLVLGIGLIYLCLVLALNSMTQPVVILVAIPSGFVGVVFAFWAHGMEMNIMAVIGLLGLAGVVVNDSLVMVVTIAEHRDLASAMPLRAQIAKGSATRLRAVLITSLTTLAGVFPLAYGFGGTAGWLRPMVMAIGWGLLVATFLTLFLVPSIVHILDDFGRLGRKLSAPFRRAFRRASPAGEEPFR